MLRQSGRSLKFRESCSARAERRSNFGSRVPPGRTLLGREDRIGQPRPIFIHKLICQDTIEERILETQKSNAAFVESLL